MAHTNSTDNYGLPQWIGTDKPTFLGDFNSAFSTIDTAMKNNADAATTAVSTANTASTAATTASTNATTALNTANSAATDAATAVTTAGAADTKATQALAAASTAETAAAANTITNLAPAYDSTLTYAVGDLVTYVDAQGSGKLYKCIVAVGTPEEFNINKWDDVTTSEAYATAKKIVATVTATGGVTTWGELLESLNDFSFDKTKNYWLVESYANGSDRIFVYQAGNDDGEATFTRIEFSVTSFTLWNIIIAPSSRVDTIRLVDTGNTMNNITTATVSSFDTTWRIIEF